MKKRNIKMGIHLIVSILVCFVVIYLFVFFGGWQLFEAGDPILLEIAAAIAVGFILWIVFEISKFHEAKIEELEKRIEALEKKE